MGNTDKGLTEPVPAPRFYADGLASAQLKGGVMQFVLFTDAVGEELGSARQVELVLVMPVEAVMPGVRMVLGALGRGVCTACQRAFLRAV